MKRARIILLTGLFLCLFGSFTAAQALDVSGRVFDDRNENGTFDRRDKPLEGVAVSDGVSVTVTGKTGEFALQSRPERIVFVSVPGTHHAPKNRFYRNLVDTKNPAAVDFPLVRNHSSSRGKKFRFVFASDTHVSILHRAVEGTTKAYEAIMALKPDLVIHGGDIVLDALKADQETAQKQYDLYVNKLEPLITAPFYHTLGNHDVFGWLSLPNPNPEPPLYGKKMYEKYFGPRYYSFNYKHCHFVVLDSIALGRPLPKEATYYGFIDQAQLDWLKQDLKEIAPSQPVIVVTHIPTINALSSLYGLKSEVAATPAGDIVLKHQVSNFPQLFGEVLKGYNFKLALAGHYHTYEEVHWQTNAHNALFVVGGSVCGEWWKGDRRIGFASWPEGFTLIKVDGERFDVSYVSYGWKGEEEQ